MTEVTFHDRSEIEDELLRFTVIAARFDGKWIFVRHKQRTTWENPGGRREPGESIDEAARRELLEETGAEQIFLQPICAYGVTRDGETSCGMLYIAEAAVMGKLPEEFEMAEIMLTHSLPKNLTYPDIAPHLFEKVQAWMNLQNSADELWDVYDADRNLTGQFLRRGDPMEAGDYHLVVEAWMMNSEGKFLLTKRSPNKGFPNMWESTGGSALAGDDSLTAVLREVREESGLTLDPNKGTLLFTLSRGDSFKDIWLFRQDFALTDVVLQPGETTDKMYADRETILRMRSEGEFIPFSYPERLFSLVDELTKML